MFIFDCLGKNGRLWKIKGGKARPLPFGFIQNTNYANNGVQRTPTRRHARCLVASLPAPVAPTVRGR
jgi:hypothetical protein